MDKLLKARKLSSASARRKRIQQQEEDAILAQEKYIEHKRRILYDDLFEEDAEHSHSDSGYDTMISSRHERDDSVQTLSECSVATPQDTPLAQSEFESPCNVHLEMMSIANKPELQIVVPETPHNVDEPCTIVPPSPQPKMLASLAAPSDWQYDRFSMILLDYPQITDSPQDVTSVPELEDHNEEDSPLETARPVSYKMPKMRPSVISISSKSSSKKRRTASVQSPLAQESRPNSPPPPPPPRSEKRLSTLSTRSGFQACEAKPVEVPNLPENAMYMISNASRESFGRFSLSGGMQKKPSIPLLSAIKTSHARMSIKNLIRSPTHGRVPSVISSSRPESRSSSSGRPSTAAADILNDNYNPFETVPADLNQPPSRSSFRLRPKSSHRPSTSGVSHVSQYSVTALPTPPTKDDVPDPMSQPQPGSMRRKKSFTSLRKRSESIGQAFRLGAMRTKSSSTKHEESPPPPPVPVLMPLELPRTDSIDIRSFPTPPLPSPRSRKSVASYSPFPPSPRIGGPVGLGLKV